MTKSFISEQAIDEIAEELNTKENNFDEAIAIMQAKQPILFSYLLSESFKLLTKEESDYLLYLAVVIWQVIDVQGEEIPLLASNIIEEIEEKNWTLLNDNKARNFTGKLDVFFENYPQEDLLAFVEDALIDDEDSFVTKEGKELLFIGLKTEIDALCKIEV